VLLAIVALWLEWWIYYSGRENRRAIEMRLAPGDGGLQEKDMELQRPVEESANPKGMFDRMVS